MHDVIFIESIRLITHNESEGILFFVVIQEVWIGGVFNKSYIYVHHKELYIPRDGLKGII